MEDQMIWVAYSVSNILAVLFIWVSIKRPRLARLLLFLYLAGHAGSTILLPTNNHMRSNTSAIDLYVDFINGVV